MLASLSTSIVLLLHAIVFTSKTSTMIELEQAIASKQLQFLAKTTGSYSEKSVDLSLQNRTSVALSLKIPAGMLFSTSDAGEQELLLTEDVVVQLAPNGSKKLRIDAFCTNYSKSAPVEAAAMTFKRSALGSHKKALELFAGKRFSTSVKQNAIWALTNGAPVRNIEGEHADIVALKKALFAHCKQEETWYSSPQEYTINPDRSINRETVSITGKMMYTTTKGAVIQEQICKANGEVLYTLREITAPSSNPVEYEFFIKVKGWKKGNYYVTIKDGSTLIKRLDFEV